MTSRIHFSFAFTPRVFLLEDRYEDAFHTNNHAGQMDGSFPRFVVGQPGACWNDSL